MTGLRRLESQESAQPQLSSVPLSLPPSTDSTSPLTSRGRTQTAAIYHLERAENHLFGSEKYQNVSLKLISSLKTRGIKDQVFSHLQIQCTTCSVFPDAAPSPLQILIQPPAALRNAIHEQAQQGYASAAQKAQSYPNWDSPLFLPPKRFTTFDPTPDFDSSLPP